jgi:hypothetical protein
VAPIGADSLHIILADECLAYVGGSCVRAQSESPRQPNVEARVDVVMEHVKLWKDHQ